MVVLEICILFHGRVSEEQGFDPFLLVVDMVIWERHL